MESKLKALKVVELREILSKAQVSLSGKANKADLIAKILASPEALAIAGGPSAERPVDTPPPAAQPEPAATSPETTPPTLVTSPPATQSAEVKPNIPAVSGSNPLPISNPDSEETHATVNSASAPSTEEDPELAKRKARAARFGIPLVEVDKPKPSKKPHPQGKATTKLASTDKPEALAARAKRFGIHNAESTGEKPATAGRGSKRAAPPAESVDPEELERRKKRAERFGLNKATSSA